MALNFWDFLEGKNCLITKEIWYVIFMLLLNREIMEIYLVLLKNFTSSFFHFSLLFLIIFFLFHLIFYAHSYEQKDRERIITQGNLE